MLRLIGGLLKRVQGRILELADSMLADIAETEGFTTEVVTATRKDARNRLSLDFDLLQVEALGGLDQLALQAELERIAATVASVNAKQLTTLLGINVRAASGLGASIDKFRDRNVALIRSLVGSQLDDIRSLLENAENTGIRVEAIRAQIMERFDVSKSRAELIARDQVLKLNSEITQTRQRLAGVRRYVWTTSGDERVREGHGALEGTIQSWDAPPDTGDGRQNHPGEDFQCRCTAFPLIDEIDESPTSE